MYIRICFAFVGLDNTLCQMHGTYIKIYRINPMKRNKFTFYTEFIDTSQRTQCASIGKKQLVNNV